MDSPPAYHLVKLPNRDWRERGEALVLAPQVRHALVRFGEWHFLYRGGGYNLMLLSGPPGVGKSDAARAGGDAAVRKLGSAGNGLIVQTAALFSEHLGQSAKLVERLFADIALSAAGRPTVVVFDDAEGLFLAREQSLASKDPTDVHRVSTTLFKGIDELRDKPNLIMFATLNMAEVVDKALLSRKAHLVSFGLPTFHERRAILKRVLQGFTGERVVDKLAAATEGYSGRELTKVAFKAFLAGVGRPEDLTEADFLSAVGQSPANGHFNGTRSVPTAQKEEDLCTSSLGSESPAPATPRRRRLSFLWP